MASIIRRITQIAATHSVGTAAYIACAAGTVLACTLMPIGTTQTPTNFTPAPPPTTNAPLAFKNANNGVTFSGDISNPKLVQGDNGVIYLNLSIDTPAAMATNEIRKPTDMVVILDKSGSMSAENRMPYAKAAIRDLVSRLNQNDRFALVTFDSTANILSPFVPVTDSERSHVLSLVETVQPGTGTNMSAGIDFARSLLSENAAERSRRVILLSDGQANEGITSPEGLASMTASLNRQGSVVSAIGMGLGFNERLMSLVADQGGGNFSYLESLASLGDILSKDLLDARRVFASASEIILKLRSGVTLSDVSGYPIENRGAESGYIVRAGQLLSGSPKRLFATIQVPTASIGTIDLGNIELHYTVDGRIETLQLSSAPLQLAILEPARRAEAVASAKLDMLKDVWSSNNLGRLQQEVQGYVSRGDKAKASSALVEYRDRLSSAESANGAPLASPQLKEEMQKMEAEVNEAFAGSASDQAQKQNRLGKKLWASGVSAQRK